MNYPTTNKNNSPLRANMKALLSSITLILAIPLLTTADFTEGLESEYKSCLENNKEIDQYNSILDLTGKYPMLKLIKLDCGYEYESKYLDKVQQYRYDNNLNPWKEAIDLK